MLLTDNLLISTQSFLTPETLQRFSNVLGQPVDKVQAGLRSVIPTLLMGLVNKAKTPEGAETIVKLVKEENFDIEDPLLISGDEIYLQKGSHALRDIFGNNLAPIVSKLGTTTGLSSQLINRLLGLAAPMVMSVLGSKITQEEMGARGVMGFLNQQGVNLSGYIPSTITNAFSAGGKTIELPDWRKNVPWTLILIAGFMIFAFLLWLTGNESSRRNEFSTLPVKSSGLQRASSLKELNAYVVSGELSQLPKRFRFENLVFATGSAVLASDAEAELDQVAKIMKQHPNTLARLEGYTDNLGDPATNKALSQKRAEAVKWHLVNRGVEEKRIEAAGLGQASPLKENTTEEGRAHNRRIEFIITRM